MRFLIDESVSGDVTAYLRSSGHDVVAIAEITPGVDDNNVLSRATAESRILITNDKDFGELVFRSGLAHHGVLLLRLRDESAASQVRVLSAALDQYADRLAGQFAVIEEQSIRIHGNMILLLKGHPDSE